jgi:hypothetical protein
MEVSGLVHAVSTVLPAREVPGACEYEAFWATELIRVL